MGKLRFLLAALGVVLSLADSAQAADHFVLIVNTLKEDSRGHGDTLYDNDYYYKQILKSYPKSIPLFINETENVMIRRKLDQFAHDPDLVIDALIVDSHGMSFDESATDPRNPFKVLLGNESSKFFLLLSDRKSVESIFRPIVGRFASGAKIIFTGCFLLAFGNERDKFQMMSNIAQSFGLKDGGIYMNESAGTTQTEIYFAQPADAGGASEMVKWRKLFQLGAVVMLPLMWYSEHYEFNQGHFFRIHSSQAKGLSSARMTASTFDRAFEPF